MRPLTTKQIAAVEFVGRYQLDHGRSPTYRQLAKHLGVTLPTAYERVGSLITKGWFRTKANRRNGPRRVIDFARGVSIADLPNSIERILTMAADLIDDAAVSIRPHDPIRAIDLISRADRIRADANIARTNKW